MLIGRENELELIGHMLAEARLGRSRALVLVGGPGVGKTALLDEAVQRADGTRVLRVAGTEAERDVPFAALHALVWPMLDLLDAIPASQARALRGALAIEEVEAERLAAYAGTLSLLAAAAERTPVFVAVDDTHWIDRASLEALVFAARRLAGSGVATVFATWNLDPILTGSGIGVHEVLPLEAVAARELLHRRWGSRISQAVARRLVTATGGNPLALVELPGLLTDDQRAGREPLDDPLPVSEMVRSGVRHRLRGVPAAVRDALLLAAAGAPDAMLTEAPLDAAEEAGLIQVGPGPIHFPHPLFGAAIYRIASPRQRRAAHRRIADLLVDPDDADRRAWHLAAASDGLDDRAADALEAAAARAHARGGFAAQAAALARAAELSGDRAAQARRLLEAAAAAYWSGDAAMAVGFAERALPLADDPILRARVVHRLAVIADWHGGWHDRVVPNEALEQEAAAVGTLDAPLAVGLLGVILQRRFQALDTGQALELAERRLAMCEAIGGERRLRAVQDLARAAGLRGDAGRAGALCDEVLETLRTGGHGGVVAFATNIAEPLVWLERYAECRDVLERSIDAARAEGNVVRLTFELTNLGLLELRTSTLTRAIATASEAADLATETGNDYLLACNLAILAHLSAAGGDGARHADHAGRAAAIAERLSDELIAGEVRLARAEWALVEGRASDAIDALEPLAALVDRNEVGEPGVLPYAPDLIEAYVKAGRADDAARLLERFDEQGRALGRGWAAAAAARCRGLLADDAEVDAWFRRALVLHEQAGWSPFQRARTLLLYGERLRRGRRRAAARGPLHEAVAEFDALGAAPWADHARAELEASGERVPRRDLTAPERLTAQELQIALQVAAGRSNRDVAAALYMSPKTVEYHLTHVYRKLDLRSRAELVRLFAGQLGAPLAPSDAADRAAGPRAPTTRESPDASTGGGR